jgi:hypothetical protein
MAQAGDSVVEESPAWSQHARDLARVEIDPARADVFDHADARHDVERLA